MTIIALFIIVFLFANIFTLFKRNVDARKSLRVKVEELHEEVNQRKQLEVLLRNVLNSSANGIVAFEPVLDIARHNIVDFTIATTNTQSAELIDKTHDEIKGKSFLEVFPESIRSGLFVCFVEVATKDQKFHDYISFVDRGQEKWLEIYAIKNDTGVVATFTDVTLKKNMSWR
ncbi:MAG: PAS domain-containing protein [Cyclobacteriaceae bacterium]|nr:PAS domain-containing protein [Cyclobacteriaceae bacterium]